MALTGQSDLRGAAELARLLDAMPRKLSKVLLVRALRKGAQRLQREMRSRAPKRSDAQTKAGRKPGHLRRNIRVRSAQGRGDSAPAVDVYLSKGAFYGKFLEFGTSRQPARPWMRPAYDAEIQAAIDDISAQLGKEVNEAVSALAAQFGTLRVR